ncbi:MAG: acyl-ACP--UDP-N-acetylglucosamine O-acyltransferase [Chloroherpetonaceae bacterium]|nr:acyl-ACP--UDP-N-acetylglucosamine O-acyltransferase [Chloroherpetonaceae bacterium]MDW8437698.1 acyl-ACP--UDP-N-acetylglucosamine O-acyltransferase [Chloroherpetonaceae bacterium]
MSVEIHPTAIVSPKAKLADGVSIGAFAVVEDDVEIGEGTLVQPRAHIASGARIGKRCRIFVGAVVSMIPQDLKFKGETSFVVVGDETTIREYATLHRGTGENGKTVVGSNCLIMAYVHLAHDVVVGDHVIISNATQVGGHCEIGDHATIGGVCGIHQFTRVGRHAMVASSSRVVYDVPPFVMAGREPFRYEGLNLVGLKRRGFPPETLKTLRDIYRVIFQTGLLLPNALERVKAEFPPSPERDEIIAFFESGNRRQFIRGQFRGES